MIYHLTETDNGGITLDLYFSSYAKMMEKAIERYRRILGIGELQNSFDDYLSKITDTGTNYIVFIEPEWGAAFVANPTEGSLYSFFNEIVDNMFIEWSLTVTSK